jgi:hypothetical protein
MKGVLTFHQVHEVKGANAPELRTQTDLLIYDAFPRMFHNHPFNSCYHH